MAKTPASVPLVQSPPRSTAPGSERSTEPGLTGTLPEGDPGPPKQLTSFPNSLDQWVQLVARSSQSATHSQRFPTMSNMSHCEMQDGFAPVGPTFPLVTL